MQLDVLNNKGEKTGRKIELPDDIFAIEPNDHVLYLAVKRYQAAQRQGTHRVKNRKEVKGASRKLHKQKGTGGSRKGNIRNPLYKGGGTIFGPKPHLYHLKLNKKEKDLAKVSALSYKAKESAIMIVEEPSFKEPKTKEAVQLLKNLNISTKKTLWVTKEYQDTLTKSVRNIPKVDNCTLLGMNVFNILNADVLVFSETAAKIFTEDVNND
ncbi:MAG: 50S ribosomal protein L4 [Phycisphaerales bacterium]|nr:50S ribosomal protein L4 [Phycisphaerales bacterium]